MGKTLVIVESPAKAKTINKYLGSDFVVRSSVGHIRDLPVSGSGARRAKSKPSDKKSDGQKDSEKKNKKPLSKERQNWARLVARMGLDPKRGWKAQYEILPGKEKVVKELKHLAKSSDEIYLATDLDREGEAIAWHLSQIIGGDEGRYRRVIFNEITRKAVEQAFSSPGQIDSDRVEAQQARRFLDRVVGYMLSPLLWKKVARNLSAGRVQSVAVRLVVEREAEIRAFRPEEYWELFADTRTADGQPLRLAVALHGGDKFRPGDKATTDAAMEVLRKASYSVIEREDKPTRTRPRPPFITSTLQQAASTRLGFGVGKTMRHAQALYEAGHITYMRTDSTNLSDGAINDCRSFVQATYGADYHPKEPRRYASGKQAQEAHEAIRPSNVQLLPDALPLKDRDTGRLYRLIWQQFVACQMEDARFKSTRLRVAAGDYELRANGRVMLFDGYTKVLPPTDEDAPLLPDLARGDALELAALDPVQHFTKPPPRYTEASLVRELEKRGIGRPSTYASIIATIQERGYVRAEKRRFYAEKIGEIVTGRLQESFQDLMSYDFTANLETALDQIARGERSWREVLDDFYADFNVNLDKAETAEGGMRVSAPTQTDIACPDCERLMQIRVGGTGVFLGCSGYALPPKERCKQTINLMPGEEAISDDEDGEALNLMKKRRCPECGTAMENYLMDARRKLHICGRNPDCTHSEVEEGSFRIKGYDGPTLECDKCGSEMQLKTGRFGKYFGCSNAECKNTRKLLRNGQAAPPKMEPIPMPHLQCRKVDDHYVLRDGAAGLFLAASSFPKHRETRAPLVEEITGLHNQLEEKYQFLLQAPPADPQGNKTAIKFSRKTREQYVASQKNGTDTKWRAFYRDGQWVAADKK